MAKITSPLLLGIPWDFAGSGTYAQWSWNEPGLDGRGAFDAIITRNDSDYAWDVRVPAGPVLGRGAGLTKDDCEAQVLQTIGKAFARLTLPLQSVRDLINRSSIRNEITAAARKYTLADGELRDLSELDSRLVDLHLVDGSTQRGTLKVGEWSLVLDNGTVELDVFAGHVSQIVRVP